MCPGSTSKGSADTIIVLGKWPGRSTLGFLQLRGGVAMKAHVFIDVSGTKIADIAKLRISVSNPQGRVTTLP